MKRKWLYLLTTLTLAVGVWAKPMVSGAAAIDLTKKDCSLTVYPESPNLVNGVKFEGELDAADIVVDVYKVATAEKVPGYDSYSYKLTEKYKSLEGEFGEKLSVPDMKAADWESLAQETAELALGDYGKDAKESPTAGTSIKSKSGGTINDLETGLYLVIARSSKMTKINEYEIKMESEDPNSEINGNIATIANSDQYTFIFQPELVSIPMRKDTVASLGKGPDSAAGPFPNRPSDNNTGTGNGENENGMEVPDATESRVTTSADEGDWNYSVKMNLKPIRVQRFGPLKIEKTLSVYESEEEVDVGVGSAPQNVGQDEKVTFVFRAEWEMEKKDGEEKAETESRVDSITFGDTGRKEVVLERIPAGKPIKVTEEYSGGSYELDGTERTQTVTVKADVILNGIAKLKKDGTVISIIGDTAGTETAGTDNRVIPTISFRNTYNRRQTKGYGIKNQFTYDGEKWIWTSDPAMDGNNMSMETPKKDTAGGLTGGETAITPPVENQPAEP